MSLWCDEKYLRLVSPQLERFTQKHAHTFNFRCPLCGDSERSKTKARGFVFPKNNVLIFKCHNCGVSLPFAALLKRLSRHLYDEYLLEELREKMGPQRAPEPPPNVQAAPPSNVQPSPLRSLSEARLTSDSASKRVCEYVAERKIPDTAWKRLFLTSAAYDWILPLVGQDKAAKVVNGEPYLVLPLRLPDGEWYGAQLRLLTRKEYITFRWSHEPLKVFGLDAWNSKLTTYVVEGPIDSLFVPNAIAACSSDLFGPVRMLEDKDILSPRSRRVYVWDNEPRNAEVRKHIRTAVRLHENVVIWPKGFPKDINDMVREGIDVLDVIGKRTFSGLMAELEYEQWVK